MNLHTAHVKNRRESGFTLVELMVVIAIIAILASVGVPKMTAFIKTAETSEAVQQSATIVKYVKAWYSTHPNATRTPEASAVLSGKTLLAAGSGTITTILPTLSVSTDSDYDYYISTVEDATDTDIVNVCVMANPAGAGAADLDNAILYSSVEAADDATDWEGNVHRAAYVDGDSDSLSASGVCGADGKAVDTAVTG